jgi:hypothetical protein
MPRRALVPGDVVCIREDRTIESLELKPHFLYEVAERFVHDRYAVLALTVPGSEAGRWSYVSAGDCHLADGAAEREYRRAKQRVDAMVAAKAEREARRGFPGRKKVKP